jgi:hypothetical protein
MTVAAIISVALLSILVVFQAALALGVPWGQASWGGGHSGTLPPGLRVASAIAGLVVYPLVILAVLEAAALAELDWFPEVSKAVMWGLAGLFLLGAVANLASRSQIERLWGPVAAVLAGCCAVIALAM